MMFDLDPFPVTTLRPQPRADVSAGQPSDYDGPERRSGGAALGRHLLAMLDEVDYGLLLVSADARVAHVNQAARVELDASHPLRVLGHELRARNQQDAALLHGAFVNARRGMRRLLILRDGDRHVNVSIVPLAVPFAVEPAAGILIILGKRQVCEQLSIQGYARVHRLTPAETRVLIALSQGTQPNDIAVQQGVAISTVRTQINNIRLKTGALSIAALVRQVAVLPPLMSTLRSAA
jgi:DNA-binding CsgD family transcriptional regulator